MKAQVPASHRETPFRRPVPARLAPPRQRLTLPRALGNQAYGRLVQAKLTVGAPGDVYEREADGMADRVMRMPEPVVQRQAEADEEEETLQRTAAEGGGKPALVPPRVAARIERARDGGRPLGTAERAFFEPRLGYDLGGVRVHTGGQAAAAAGAMQARAFTVGRDVVFGHGAYAPHSPAGRRLMAHELSHTIQQGAVARRLAPSPGIGMGPVRRTAGAPRLQRVPLTRGQFGQEMEHYRQDVGLPARPFDRLWRSSTFRGLVRTLDGHYVSLSEPSLPSYFQVESDGTLVNDPSLNARWAGSGRRVIHLFTSGVDESSAFEPASQLAWPYDMIWLHDIFYWSQAPSVGAGMPNVEKDRMFMEALAHETTHAHNLVTGAGHGTAGPSPTLAASIVESVQEEIGTRQQEAEILRETRGNRGPRPRPEPSREVERSMVSGSPRRTYLEAFFFAHKLSDARQAITDDEARRIERNVEGIPLSAVTADQYLNRNAMIFYFDRSVGLYDLVTSDYGKWLFWQRVVHERWEAFEALANPPASAKERILQQHATAYFDPGIAYAP